MSFHVFSLPLVCTKLSPSRHFRVSVLLLLSTSDDHKTAKYILPKESGGNLYDKFIKKYPFYNMAL
jgi:hypothetical protein